MVLFTGSNDPLDFPNSDAWGNLSNALMLVNIYFHPSGITRDYINSGAYVVFHNRLVDVEDIRKQPFACDPNGMSYCNDSDLGDDPAREDSFKALNRKILEHYGLKDYPKDSPLLIYDVNVVRENHDEFLKDVRERKPKAVLLILYHSGTANTKDPIASVSKLVTLLREQGIVCFGVTENGEPVNLRSYGTSLDLRNAGLVPLYNMKGNAALVKLMILSKNYTGVDLIREMLTNQVGEIDPSAINDVQDLNELYSKNG